MRGRAERVPWASASERLVVLACLDGHPHLVAVPLASTQITPGANVAGEPRDTPEAHGKVALLPPLAKPKALWGLRRGRRAEAGLVQTQVTRS